MNEIRCDLKLTEMKTVDNWIAISVEENSKNDVSQVFSNIIENNIVKTKISLFHLNKCQPIIKNCFNNKTARALLVLMIFVCVIKKNKKATTLISYCCKQKHLDDVKEKIINFFMRFNAQHATKLQIFLDNCYNKGYFNPGHMRRTNDLYALLADQSNNALSSRLGKQYTPFKSAIISLEKNRRELLYPNEYQVKVSELFDEIKRKITGCFTQVFRQYFIEVPILLGDCYSIGCIVSVDKKRAADLYTISANQGNANAQWRLGALYENAECFDEAREFYTRSADQKNAIAQLMLAKLYEFGKGVNVDLKKASKFYTLSAEQGNARAQSKLGNFYQFGIGVPINLNKALKLYTLSADQGDANGQVSLGMLHTLGNVGAAQPNRAKKLFALASKQGDPLGQYMLSVCYHHGFGVDMNITKMIKYCTLSAEQNYLPAQLILGNAYLNGIKQNGQLLLELDEDKAYKWYLKCVRSHNKEAKNILKIHWGEEFRLR